MSKLYELTGEIKSIESLVESDELSIDDAKDTIQALEMEFKEKAIAITQFIENINPDISALDEHIKKLTAKEKALQNKQESLREYLRENMMTNEISKIECPFFSILLKSPAAAVDITDSDALPDEYVAVKTTVSPDKKAILKALKDGIDVPGAQLKQAKPALQIK